MVGRQHLSPQRCFGRKSSPGALALKDNLGARRLRDRPPPCPAPRSHASLVETYRVVRTLTRVHLVVTKTRLSVSHPAARSHPRGRDDSGRVTDGRMAAREGDRRSLRLRNMAERHGLPISQSKTRLLARFPAPVVITVVFTSFISVTYGFGVYLFAALMPEMRATLTFDYAFAGAVAGYAQIGYLSSSLAIGFLAPLIGPARTVAGSMVICTICLLALSGIEDCAAQSAC